MADPDDEGEGGDEAPGGESSVPDLEAILHASQGIGPDFLAMAGQMAHIHGEWRKAWTATGVFTPDEAFELVRVLVAASAGGISSLY